MKQNHIYERKQFEALFQQEKIDRLDERLAVLDAFLANEGHILVLDLVDVLKSAGKSFSDDFVEETLELMCRYGFAQKNRFDNGILRYEHRHLGQHHDHMICTKCKKIIEFENDRLEALQFHIAREYGFHMLQHKMEIYGICGDCLSEHVSRMPLSMARSGERLVIKELIGGNKARLRLMSMGMKLGDVLDVINNCGNGQVVVAMDTQRYVMGRGLAQKIIVEIADPADIGGVGK